MASRLHAAIRLIRRGRTGASLRMAGNIGPWSLRAMRGCSLSRCEASGSGVQGKPVIDALLPPAQGVYLFGDSMPRCIHCGCRTSRSRAGRGCRDPGAGGIRRLRDDGSSVKGSGKLPMTTMGDSCWRLLVPPQWLQAPKPCAAGLGGAAGCKNDEEAEDSRLAAIGRSGPQ